MRIRRLALPAGVFAALTGRSAFGVDITACGHRPPVASVGTQACVLVNTVCGTSHPSGGFGPPTWGVRTND